MSGSFYTHEWATRPSRNSPDDGSGRRWTHVGLTRGSEPHHPDHIRITTEHNVYCMRAAEAEWLIETLTKAIAAGRAPKQSALPL